ncbi:hypothetical protein Tco_1407750 [Tanacetum coccineum]
MAAGGGRGVEVVVVHSRVRLGVTTTQWGAFGLYHNSRGAFRCGFRVGSVAGLRDITGGRTWVRFASGLAVDSQGGVVGLGLAAGGCRARLGTAGGGCLSVYAKRGCLALAEMDYGAGRIET